MRSTPGDSLNFEIFKRILLCMLDSCVSLFLEIVVSHKIVGVLIFSSESVILPRGCQSALLSDILFTCLRGDIRLIGLEPMTPRLSSACSNRLSYSRLDI